MQYNENGATVSVLDPNEVGWDAGTALGTFDGYDARGRLTDRIDTNGDTSSSVYDKNNNVVLTTDAKSQTDTCSFDARDRKYSCIDRVLSDTRLRYDQNSNLTILKDGEDQQTEYMYDERNLKVLSQFPDHVTGQNPGDANYGITTCTYDAAKRKFRYEDQLGDTKTHIYDMADRLKQRDYRLRVNSPSGTIADSDVMTYDDSSRVLTAVSGRYSNTVTLTYDDANRKATEKLTILSKNFKVTSTYDAANRRTQIKYPDNSTVARMYTDRDQLEDMHYDSDGAGAGAAIHVEHRVYDNAMRLTQCQQNLTGGGGAAFVTTDVTYRGNVSDPGDNLTETITTNSTAGGGTLVNSFTYSYDANKNKLKETIGGPLSPYGFGTTVGQEVVYDGEDRVTDWHRDDTLRDLNYALSKVGDWNTFTVEGVTETRTHGNAHELTNLAGGANPGALTHDAKGNILTSPAHGSQTYTWDFDNQLKQAVIGGTHKYYYDALGRRVMKHVAGENRLIFVHDGQQIIAEYKYTNGVIGIPGGIDAGASTTSQSSQTQSNAAVVIGTRRGAATIQRKYVYCTYIDERCLMIDRTTKGALPAGTEELFYYHTNNLYSVAAMTDAAGLITERYAYDAYGNILQFGPDTGTALGTPIAVSALGNPYTYTGRRLDDETENYHYRSRYYQAPLGRFLGRDRILYGDGYNMYAYVGGGPLDGLDPSGLWKHIGGTIYEAEGCEDSLMSLSWQITGQRGGTPTNDEWVCIWPKPDKDLWSGYPYAKPGARADVKNLLATNGGDTRELKIMPRLAATDHYLLAVRIILNNDRRGGRVRHWRDGPTAARMIKGTSREGRTPIRWMVVGAHCGGGASVGDFRGRQLFQASDLAGVATESDNSINSYASASAQKGPPKCWFTRSSHIWGAGCNTNTWANDWAAKVLRRGATAHGTRFFMFGTWIPRGGGGSATLRFTHDVAGTRPVDGNVARNLGATLALPRGWMTASGTQ